MSLPPVFAASALYDSLLQAALRQFFSRATFETEPIPSLSSDGRLAIEPTSDPSVLSIRWFGSRHVLHVPARARSRRTRCGWRGRSARCWRRATARSSIRSRCSSAATCFAARSRIATSARFSTRRRTATPSQLARRSRRDRDRGAARRRALELREPVDLLRRARRSTETTIRCGRGTLPTDEAYRYSQALTGIKSFYRLCDGLETLFLVNRSGVVLDIVEIARYAKPAALAVPCAAALPAARPRHRRQPQPLHRAQPVARDQGVRRGRADVQLPQRALAPDRSAGQVPDVGGRGRQSGARRAAVPDGARPGRLTRGRAVRRAARRRGVAVAARRAGRSARCGAPHRRGRADPRPAHAHAARAERPRARPGRARRPGAHRRRDGHGSAPAGCSRSAPFSCTPNRRSRTRTSRSKARARRRRWRPAVWARCSRSAKTA